jgi:hypothetical protein
MRSRSAKAWGEISTRKAMLLPESLFSFAEREAFATVKLLHAFSDGREGLGAFQAVQQFLIAVRSLNDELRAAVYGEHQRGPTPLEPADIVLLA